MHVPALNAELRPFVAPGDENAPAGAGTLHAAEFDSPLGSMVALVHGERGLALLDWTDRAGLERAVRSACVELGARGAPAEITRATHPLAERARTQLAEYFAGERRAFDMPLAPLGTPFQRRAWEALGRIAYGATRSYGAQAREIGNPAAVRAVALANGANFRCVVIPCHRVVGADGSLTGFGGGLHRKRWLLEHEARGMR
jgi:O-6-methylguanine DNA methyltransferase